MTNLQVLLLIAAFLTLTIGSFVWYIATWDSTARTSKVNDPSDSRMHGLCTGCVQFLPAEIRG